MSGARRWASSRSVGTRERYWPTMMGRVGSDGRDGNDRIDRVRRSGVTPITTPSSSAPVTTAWSPPPTWPGPGCGRCSSRPARSSAARPPASRSPARTVNICNCDHLTFRTTPVIEDLALAEHGLRYIDMEPAPTAVAWSGGAAVARSGTTSAGRSTSWRRRTPARSTGTARYLDAARPAVELILAAATEPPTAAGLTRLAVRRRLAGVPTVMRWSRRSAADVMRSYFTPRRAASAPGWCSGRWCGASAPSSRAPGSARSSYAHAPRRHASVGRSAAAAR